MRWKRDAFLPTAIISRFSTSSGQRPASPHRGSHETVFAFRSGFVPPAAKAGFSEFFRTNVKGYRAPSARPFPSLLSYRGPAPRRHKLRIIRFRRCAKAHSLRCSSFPKKVTLRYQPFSGQRGIARRGDSLSRLRLNGRLASLAGKPCDGSVRKKPVQIDISAVE